MNELEIITLYETNKSDKSQKFKDNISSTLHIKQDYDKQDTSYEWLEIMEDTIRYLDNILRNPNRFIINEEDIVKIELARRVTVESIKHLSKNTNLIQDYNQETGDVRPSKILNINKEESFDTYENRFIYSLIKNMKYYIERKKKNIPELSNHTKDNKSLEYTAQSNIGKENIDIKMTMTSQKEDKKITKNEDGLTIPQRIERLETQISDLTSSSVYQSIEKKHITLVTSPIKKTNVILKNVNFQYAVKLWNYMQTNMDDDTKQEKENKDYYDDGPIKKLIDESFLLDYLVLDTLGQKEETNKKDLPEKLVGNMLEKIITLDSSIDETKLKELIEKQYSIIKYKTVVNEKQIEETYKKYMDKYIERIKTLEI